MAINHGDKFDFAQLIELAASANASPVSKAVDYFKMTYDDSAQPWGYRIVDRVKITNAGALYQVGDLLSLGWGTQYEVGAVGESGQIKLLRAIDKGYGLFSDTMPISGAFTGGSGSGATAAWSIVQVGPNVNYDFGQGGNDYNPLRGQINQFFMVSTGKEYQVGNELTWPEWTASKIIVDAVASDGSITAWHSEDITVTGIVPENYDLMLVVTGSGYGAKFGGYPILEPKPSWRTELNRLRWYIADYINNTMLGAGRVISPEKLCCSGPWPTAGITENFEDTNFYYEDNGVAESVTLACDLPSLSPSPFEVAIVDKDVAYIAPQTYGTHMEFSICVGGSSPLQVTGSFTFNGFVAWGGTFTYNPDASLASWTPDGVDPISLVAISGNFPGAMTVTSTPVPTSPTTGGTVSIKFDINESLAPGIYTLILDVTAPADGTSQQTHTGVNFLVGFGGSVLATGTSSITVSTAEVAPAIHSFKTVKKIKLPTDLNGLAPVIYAVDYYCTNGASAGAAWRTPPYPQPTFDSAPTYKSFNLYVTTSCNGFWSAKTKPLTNPNFVTPADMPWNYIRTKTGSAGGVQVDYNPMLLGGEAPDDSSGHAQVSNSYDQSLPVEYQRELPEWKANTYFSAGFNILAADGNVWRCVRAGNSQSSVPSWAAPNNVTAGGVYYYETSADSGLMWQRVYTPDPPFTQSEHRPRCIPNWPTYWTNETESFLKPPTADSGPTRFGTYGQWVMGGDGGNPDVGWQKTNGDLFDSSLPTDLHGAMCGAFITFIAIDKIRGFPDGDTGPTSVYDVEIGCMRNGAFVSFGHFNSGNTYKVLWPVFTTDALVYLAAERMQIRALASKGSVSADINGGVAAFPNMAAFINDTAAVIDLLP